MPPVWDILIARTLEEWAVEAATSVCDIGRQAVQSSGRFLFALAGGTTPERLYRTLASPAFTDRFDWSTTTFFFGDERCVPPDHPDSNYGLARRSLFTPLAIAPTQICRMPGEAADPENAARDYAQQLRAASRTPASTWPRLDLILLGMGEDGHTASLFPGTTPSQNNRQLVTVTQSPKGIATRLTITLGVINQASVVLFLVTGSQKAPIVKRVLEPATEADRRLPSASVKPENGRLIWLLDQPAAAMLTARR